MLLSREDIVKEIEAKAKERLEKKKLERMQKAGYAKRYMSKQNNATLNAIIEDIDENIQGKISMFFGYDSVTNKLITIAQTLQYLKKDDRDAVDPAYYEIFDESIIEEILESKGNTPYFREAVIVTSDNNTKIELEPSMIVDGERPDVDKLIDVLSEVALELDLVDYEPECLITDRKVDTLFNRAQKKAETEMELSKTIVISDTDYEE